MGKSSRDVSEQPSECNPVNAENIRLILWRLAHKQFGPGDWKKLALHWAFTHEQIQAIEHQHTGKNI